MGAWAGKIGSWLTAPDRGETSPISSPVHFTSSLHKYPKSPAPPRLTLPILAPPPSSYRQSSECWEEEERRSSLGRKREKSESVGGREKKLTAAPDSSIAPMAGDIVVVEADPWDPSDVTEEML